MTSAEAAASRPSLWRQGAALLGAGCVLLFFSEFFFLNEGPVEDVVAAGPGARIALLGELALYYAAFAIPMLAALCWFGVRSWTGLFLAACLYGWATEGVLIPVVYENLPWSYSWTSIGWHVLIDVFVGLVLLPRALAARRVWVAPGACIALGVAWGYWATWLWVEGTGLAPEDFAVLVGWTFPLLAIGTVLIGMAGRALLAFDRRVGLAGSLLAIPFAALQAAAAPLGGVGLAALILVTLAMLRGEDRRTPRRIAPERPPSPLRWLWLGLVPAAAIPTYGALHGTDIPGASDLVLPVIFLAGVAAFPAVLALRLWQGQRSRG